MKLALASLVLLSGCMTVTYRPVAQDALSMERLDAYKIVSEAVGEVLNARCVKERSGNSLGGSPGSSLDGEGVTLICEGRQFRFLYARTPLPVVERYPVAQTFLSLIDSDGQRREAFMLSNSEQEKAARLAKAWSVLARPAAAEPPFAAALVTELPERARRFKVQAELAVKRQDFIGAALAYRDGLAIAPGWAQGRFNSALVLGELGLRADAAREMGRYLTLLPDAANARQAQDKIYEWEAQAPRAQPAARKGAW